MQGQASGERPVPSLLQNKGGMEPDDLLCSRNARSKTPLVGRAQWKINQAPSLKKEQASLKEWIFSLPHPTIPFSTVDFSAF